MLMSYLLLWIDGVFLHVSTSAFSTYFRGAVISRNVDIPVFLKCAKSYTIFHADGEPSALAIPSCYLIYYYCLAGGE